MIAIISVFIQSLLLLCNRRRCSPHPNDFMFVSQSLFLFSEFHLYVWNITFTRVNLVSALPPCYHELLVVQKGHGLPGFIYGNKNTKGRNVLYKYQFCGVRSQLYLYPEDLDVEVIYENNKVISYSEFTFQFQVIDYGLVESFATGVMIKEIGHYDPQQLSLAGWTSVVISSQILVNKLSQIKLTVTPGKEKYIIYSGPIIQEQFRVKNFRGSVNMPSFQCIVVVYTIDLSLQRKMTYITVRHNLPVLMLEKDKEYFDTFPNGLCRHSYGIYCTLKVS